MIELILQNEKKKTNKPHSNVRMIGDLFTNGFVFASLNIQLLVSGPEF